jgi:hypothetical protein
VIGENPEAKRSMEYEFLLILGAIVLAAVFVVAYTIFWGLRNLFSRTRHVRATVVRRKSKPWNLIGFAESDEPAAPPRPVRARVQRAIARLTSRLGWSEDGLTEGQDYIVTFAFEGHTAEFTVPESTFVRAEPGAEGMLEYKGEQFRRFVVVHPPPEEEDPTVIAPYRPI